MVRVLGPVLYSLMASLFSTTWMSLGSLERRPGEMHEVRRTASKKRQKEINWL